MLTLCGSKPTSTGMMPNSIGGSAYDADDDDADADDDDDCWLLRLMSDVAGESAGEVDIDDGALDDDAVDSPLPLLPPSMLCRN